MEALWRIVLFGGVRAEGPQRIVTRFRTHKTASLLAYLAYHPQRSHPRELLAEMLWPEEGLGTARHKLRVAISSLRRQLEPPGVPGGAVLVTDRASVRLNPDACATDVAEFEAALKSAAPAGSSIERAGALLQAVELYRGELLAGYYEDWILPERERLRECYLEALSQLIEHLEQRGDLSQALDCAYRAIGADPLREASHYHLMRLLAAAGRASAALEQYRGLTRMLKTELGVAPSSATRSLAQEIRRSGAQGPAPTAGQRAPERRRSRTPERPAPEGASFPPLAAQPVLTGRLPAQFTRFFGREEELARLGEMLLDEGRRLVTLTGPAGSGKTRLALEAAARAAARFGAAVWFVPLADLSDGRRVPEAVRDALRLPHTPQSEPLEQVVAALSCHPALLVLDNFEHLLGAPDEACPAALLLRTLLEQAPALSCLVTSRQRLDLSGEREFPVMPLPTPGDGRWWMVDGSRRIVEEGRSLGGPLPSTINHQPSTIHHPPSPEHLIRYASVQLFVDRAQAVQADFQLTKANAASVAELCCRLEGIPLAIELAAARAQSLSPARMLAHLEHSLDFLVSRRRDAAARHRTLRAALDWSYRLLSPELQRLFARLSVFRGGWTLEAAEAVCACGASVKRSALSVETDLLDAQRSTLNASEDAVLDALEQLRERSLVVVEPGDERRYRLLEPLREYGDERLKEAGEFEAVCDRHLCWYLALAERAEPHLPLVERAELHLPVADQGEWLDRLQREHDNLRSALRWSMESRQSESSLRLAGALAAFWQVQGYWTEGRERLAELLEQVREAAPTTARAGTQRGRRAGGAPERCRGGALLL